MKVSELIKQLSEYDGDLEVKFAVWDPVEKEQRESFPIEDVAHDQPLDHVLYIWDK